jgi:biopolymer transport protein ExbD
VALCLPIALGCTPAATAPNPPANPNTAAVVPLGSATPSSAGPVEVDSTSDPPPNKLPPGQDRALAISIDAAGTTHLNGVKLSSDDELFHLSLEVVRKTGTDACVIRVEPKVPYSRVVQVLDVLRKAGVTNIALAPTTP